MKYGITISKWYLTHTGGGLTAFVTKRYIRDCEVKKITVFCVTNQQSSPRHSATVEAFVEAKCVFFCICFDIVSVEVISFKENMFISVNQICVDYLIYS